MKNDINLAYKRPVDAKAIKNALFLLLFLVLLAALYYAATSIPNLIKDGELKKSADIDTKLTALSDTAQRFEQGTQTKKKLLESVDMLKELNANKKDVAALIDQIQTACPQDITLKGIQFNSDAMSLDGLAKSDMEISSFAFILRGIDGFKDVTVTSTETVENSDKQKFMISLSFTVPLKAEPITPPKEEAKAAAQKTTENSSAAQTNSSANTIKTTDDGKKE